MRYALICLGVMAVGGWMASDVQGQEFRPFNWFGRGERVKAVDSTHEQPGAAPGDNSSAQASSPYARRFAANQKMAGTAFRHGTPNSRGSHNNAPPQEPTIPAVEASDLIEIDSPSSRRKYANTAPAAPTAGPIAEPQSPTVVTPSEDMTRPHVAPASAVSGPIAEDDQPKSLQERLSAVRRTLVGAPINEGAHESTARSAPAAQRTVQQTAPATAAPSMASDHRGPVNGPAPPNMPNLRTAQRTTVPADRAVAPRATAKSEPVAATVAPTPAPARQPTPAARETSSTAAPVSSRRMPQGQRALAGETRTAMLPREGTQAPSVTESTTSNSAPPVAPPVALKANPSPADGVLFARQSPQLSVETTGPRSITVDKEATYTVTLQNSGSVAAQDVVVMINIPSWTEVRGAKPTSGEAPVTAETLRQPLRWHLPRLEGNAKEQLVLALVPRESRPFDLAVQWTFSPVASQAMVEVKGPKLTMSLACPSEMLYGETKVCKLSLSNPGTGDAENVVLLLSPLNGNSSAPAKHPIGTIRAGGNQLVEVELTARQAGTLTIKASASADGNLWAEASDKILVRRAGLKLASTGPELRFAGTDAAYKISITNPGNAVAENVQVAALLPPGAKFRSSNFGQHIPEQNKVVWSIPTMVSGAKQELELQCTLNSPGENRLQIVATAASDLSDTTASITHVEALADLKLTVTDPSGPMAIGDNVSYEIHITNRGTKTAENVEVAAFFSEGIEPIAATGGDPDLSPGKVVFRPLAAIAPGAEAVLKITAKAEQPGNHVFRTEVYCAALGTKLAAEETTLFYGNPKTTAQTKQPSETPSVSEPTVPPLVEPPAETPAAEGPVEPAK